MEILELKVKAREKTGKRVARNLRRAGSIPAILYGHGMAPVSLEVNTRAFNHILHSKGGENAVLQLKTKDVKLKESTCLIKQLQHNPVTDEVAHIDFTVISLTEKISVKVHVELKGAEDAVGAKEGGILDLVHHELEVECLPTNIPAKFEVDVKEMKINDDIHFKDMVLPEGVVCEMDPEEVIVTMHPPRVEEEVTAEDGEEGPAEPEVIEKGKKEEKEEGEGAEAAPKAEKKD